MDRDKEVDKKKEKVMGVSEQKSIKPDFIVNLPGVCDFVCMCVFRHHSQTKRPQNIQVFAYIIKRP